MNDYTNFATSPATQITGYAVEAVDHPSVVGDIHAEIERLSVVIDSATKRLYKVLSPEYDGPENPMSNVPQEITSDVRSAHMCLSAQINRLGALISRVEA